MITRESLMNAAIEATMIATAKLIGQDLDGQRYAVTFDPALPGAEMSVLVAFTSDGKIFPPGATHCSQVVHQNDSAWPSLYGCGTT